MSDPKDISRRLVAVFAADVEGYSRLMGIDEVGTLKALTERRAILDRFIGDHGGRIANTAGDSVLAEFVSAVDAVQCAVEAQGALAEANLGLQADKRINFRIGVHVGDVMVRGGDLFGDGVNIAARLQALALAGGVCVSGTTYDQVKKVMPVGFIDLGAQQVKNIEEPLRAYAVGCKTARAGSVPDSSKPLPLPDKPSIAVLPFQNLSGDPDQEYFADGMVEDIITALSRSKSMFVIARNSTFTYKGKPVDIRQVGRELGVRYVLEGSVRKAGARIRIAGQLIDATTGTHLWADRFDGVLEDIFDLQDRVAGTVTGVVAPQLESAEIERAQRKPTENLRAYDYYLRALASNYRFTPEANIEVRELTRTASTIDPKLALAPALSALSFSQRKAFGWDRDISREKADALQLARRAIELDQDDPRVLAWAAQTLAYVVGEPEEAAGLLSRAVELDPNLAIARLWSGWTNAFLGQVDAAIEQFQVAMRLNPLSPTNYSALAGMGWGHFLAGRNDDAITLAKTALQQRPNYLAARRLLIACYATAGRVSEAQDLCKLALQADPTMRLSDYAGLYRGGDNRQRLAQAFRLAGMPE